MPRGDTFFGQKRERLDITPDALDRIRYARDAEWSRAMGIPETMTPDQAKKWIENDRVIRARNVSEARRQRGPSWS
jgi:hypothetical protein